MGSDLYDETRAVKARVTKPKPTRKPPAKPVGPSLKDEEAARRRAAAAAAAARSAALRAQAEQRARVIKQRLAAEAARSNRDLAYETLAAKSRALYRQLGQQVPKVLEYDRYDQYRKVRPGLTQPDTSLKAETRAVVAAKRVAASGRYEAELQRLRAEQNRSGGRYVDRDTYEAVTSTYRRAAEAAAKRAVDEYDKATKLVKAYKKSGSRQDYDRLVAFIKRPEYAKAFDEYEKWFGAKRRAGRLERLEGSAFQIAKAQERYVSSQISAFYQSPDGRAQRRAEQSVREALFESDFANPRVSADRREREKPRMTLQEFLRRGQAQYDEAIRAAHDKAATRNRLLDFEGYDVQNGRARPSPTSPEGRVRTWLNKGLAAGGAKLSDYAIIDPQTGNIRMKGATQAERDRNLRLATDAAMAGWRADQKLLGQKAPALGTAPTSSDVAANIAYQKQKEAIRQQIWSALSGGAAPTGGARLMYDAVGAPVLGDALRALQFGGAVAITGGRIILKGLTGKSTIQVGFPYENLPPDVKKAADAAGGRGGVGDAGRRSSEDVVREFLKTPRGRKWMADEEARQSAESQAADSDLAQALYGAGTDPFTVAQRLFSGVGVDTINAYGSEPTSNAGLNFLLSAAIDPTIALAPLKFLGAGRIAAAKYGLKAPGAVARETWRLAGPNFKHLGLARFAGEKGALTEAKALADLGKVVGRTLRDETEVAAARADIERVLNARTEKEAGEIARRILGDEAPDREVRQLLSFVENLTGEQARSLGILPVSARNYHKLGQDLDRAILRSEQEAALARGVADRVTAEEAQRAALQPTVEAMVQRRAAAMGGRPAVPAPRAAATDPVVIQKVREAGERQLRLATEARDAFARAESMTAPGQTTQRVAAFQEAVAKFKAWDDERTAATRVNPAWGGPVDQALEDLEGALKSRPLGTRLEDVVGRLTALDVRDSLHRMIRAQKAGDVAEFAKWKTAYDAGRKALRRQREHWQTVDTVVGQHGTEAADFVRRGDVSVRIEDSSQADEWFLRRLHSRVEGSSEKSTTIVDSAEKPTADDHDAFFRLSVEQAYGDPVTFAGVPANLARRHGDDLKMLEGLSLKDTLEALVYLRNDSGVAGWGYGFYDDLFEWVFEKYVRSMGNGNLTVLAALTKNLEPGLAKVHPAALLNRTLNRYYHAWADSAPSVGIRDYELADSVYADAIAAARGHRAQGVVRPASGRRGKGSYAPRTRDTELLEVVARLKARPQSGAFAGLPLATWDQARGMLGKLNVMRVTSKVDRARAEKLANRLGRPVDEVQDELLERRRLREGRIALKKHAASMPGATADEIWASYQLRQFSEFNQASGPTVTHFQYRTYRKVFHDIAGDEPEAWLKERYFGGRPAPSPRQQLENAVPLQQFWDEPEFAGMPVFLVTHWEKNVADGRTMGIHSGEGIETTMDGPHVVSTMFHEFFHALSRRSDVKARLTSLTNDFDDALIADGHGGIKSLIEQYVRKKPDGSPGYYERRVAAYILQGMTPSQAADASLVHLFEEVVAEFYGWRRGLRAGEARLNDFFRLDPSASHPDYESIEDALAAFGPETRRMIGELDQWFDDIEAAGLLPDLRYYAISRLIDPPVANARLFREWMVARGFWSPRDKRLIEAGQMSWSVVDERHFLESHGFDIPSRLDPDILAMVVRDPNFYESAMKTWGIFGDDFDNAISAHRIKPGKDGQRAIAFGLGTARGRNLEELRRYAAERYGALVARVHEFDDPAQGIRKGDLVLTPEGDVILHDMPWLMTVSEFQANVGRFVADGLPAGVVDPARLPDFATAVQKAVKSRMDAWVKDGLIERGREWLPQERLLFTQQVADEILATGDWMGIFVKASKRRRALNLVGILNRLNIVTNIAFPVMNLIDAYTFKPLLRALHYRDLGMLPVGAVDDDALDAIRGLEDVGRRRGGVFNLGESRLGVIRERGVRTSLKVQAAFRMLPEWGLEVSAMGEDAMRLHFVRRVYMRQRDELIGRGWDAASARMAAKYGAAREVQKFFPSLEDAGDFEKALNQLIPFLSYNARNTVLGLKLVYTDPWVINLAQRLAAYVETSNREQWERLHPGEPFPEDKAHMFWIEVGGDRLWFDLSEVSDWFRGSVKLARSDSWVSFVGGLFRAPHPQQAAILAWVQNMMDGGDRETPWGAPADASIFWPVDLFNYWQKASVGDVPFALALSKTLFFVRAGIYTPTDGRIQTWKALMDSRQYEEAQAYAEANADVAAWLEEHRDPTKARPGLNGFSTNWFFRATDEERGALIAGWQGLRDLDASWDVKMAPFVDQPWSPEYRALKKQRRAAFLAWYRMHPELAMSRGWNMDATAWADAKIEWATDDDTDAYFAMADARPREGDFKDERAYFAALAAHQDAMAAFLEAHPNVVRRLRGEEGSVAAAWYDQQVRWDRILRDQTDVRIAILDEEAKSGGGDDKLVAALYEITRGGYSMLDAEAFAYRRDPSTLSDGKLLTDAGGVKIGPLTLLTPVKLPGRADYFYARANPAEQREIEERDAYFEKLDSYIARSKDKNGELDPARLGRFLDADPAFAAKYYAANPKAARGHAYYLAITDVYRRGGKYGFYRELEKNPALMAEYFRRNPAKLARYRSYKTGVEYFERITRAFQQSKTPEQFWAALEKDPWLKKQYLARNPGKAALVAAGERYWKFAKTYTDLLASGDLVAAQRYWLSHPAELRDRFFKSARGQDWAANAQYAGSMGRWVEFLKRGDYEGARRFWDQLPDWVKERYVSKHPDKADMLLTPRDLAQAGEYFMLPTVAEREAYLRKHPSLAAWMNRYGGTAEARRGAIMAAYAALPKDAWLRRMYRERYPEIYSEEALAERATRRTARRLAEHPELAGRFQDFVERIMREFPHALGAPPPTPLRTERLRAATRRRRARSRSALWADLHSRHR